jgi:signal transduction histidine kinase
MAAAVHASWPRRVRSAAPLLSVAYAVAAVLVATASRVPQSLGPTSYAGASSVAYAADIVAGILLLGAAAAALLDPASARIGLLALAAGVLWFAPDFEGWTGGPAPIRSIAAAVVPLVAAPLALLAADRLPQRLRWLAQLAATVLVGVAVARAFVRDPFLDPYCWRDCLSRTFVGRADPGLAHGLDRVWQGTSIGLAAIVVPPAVLRLRRATAPVLATSVLALAAVAAYASWLLGRPRENPFDPTFSALFYTRAAAVAALAAGVAFTVVRMRRQRAAVTRLVDALGEAPRPGRLRETLRAVFRDPTLDVAYWLPRGGHFVDTSGAFVDPGAAAGGRAVTPIVRDGSPVAVVMHDPALLGESFGRELGSAARLAVENERLQAEVLAQLEALRRSRLRIITRGDEERRRLERDLHDGAQQRLLALGYDLRLAQAAALTDDDARLAAELAAAVEQAQAALEDLRQLAHGIYPAVLAEAGLEAAVATLADDAPVPVELVLLPAERFDPAVEGALYIAIRESIHDATHRGATWVRVTLAGRVRLTIEDDGRARRAQLVHVADRVGALGGETLFGPNSLEATVPCG